MMRKKPPRARLLRATGRPLVVVYKCPIESKTVRLSTGTYDEKEAEEFRKDVEASIRLGVSPRSRGERKNSAMPWEDFRERYTTEHLANCRTKSALDAESRLDLAERIISPRILADMASPENLYRLQSRLLAGDAGRHQPKEGQPPRKRSKATVRGYMRAIIAALNWGHRQGWLAAAIRLDLPDVDDHMKGRPLSEDELAHLLDTVPGIVGIDAADSWQFVLNGIANTGLRLTELMTISWDVPQTIQPRWDRGRLPVLVFPHYAQKNDKTQEVPMSPWFEEQLAAVPQSARTGYVFNPKTLQTRYGRPYRGQRLTAERVGKIVSRIGEAAGIVVDDGDPRTGRPPKYASAHDLRRTFAQRLADAGIPPDLTRKLMRHEDSKTTERYYQTQNVQRDGERLRELVPGRPRTPAPQPQKVGAPRPHRPALRVVG